MWTSRAVLVTGTVAIAILATPAIAQMRPWGGWGQPGPQLRSHQASRSSDSREGKVEVSRFVSSGGDAATLGHGAIAIAAGPGSMSMGLEKATYEAAIVDQLVKAGYQTNPGAQPAAQVAELVITHDVVQPEEAPHDPVSGQANLGVSNWGTSVGLAVAVDLTKPAKALISTRLDATIRDKATNALLWEGHAKIVTREGGRHWTTQAIATRLAAALFEDFPNAATPVGRAGVQPPSGD